MDLRDAHYEQCKWLVKQWRDAHKHEHFPDADPSTHFAIDSSRNELPMGFTRGMRSETGDPEPIGDDPEERRRRR
jgi:hypothetical protein